jgi:hypothetical protein
MKYFRAIPKSAKLEVISFRCDGCDELQQIEVDPRFRGALFDGNGS